MACSRWSMPWASRNAQRSALAYAALRKLTGLNLPPAHEGWSRALAP
jgi:hypothetical protein